MIWSIVYQQVENTIIQPRIQARAVQVHPFVVLVSVLFGSTLFGVVGALIAIPVAAAIQISIVEYHRFRRQTRAGGRGGRAAPTAAAAGDTAAGASGLSRASVVVAAAAGEQARDRGDAATEHEARHGGADQDLACGGG